MSTTFTDLLPPTRTSPNRAVKYTPACAGVGVLELTDGRSHTRYALAVQPFGGVRLTKADGETYVVSPAACECKGFVFGRGKLCRHIDAVHCLLGNGWLEHDEVETVRDIREEADERDEFYRGHGWHAEAAGGVMVHEPLGA